MKAGIKSTEFFLTLAAMVAGIVLFVLEGAGVSESSVWVKALAGLLAVLPAPVYTAGRSSVKKAEALTSAVEAARAGANPSER